MSNFTQTYIQKALVHRYLKGDEYIVLFEKNGQLNQHVLSITPPPLTREVVETYHPGGVQIAETSSLKTAYDIPIIFKIDTSGIVKSSLDVMTANDDKDIVTVLDNTEKNGGISNRVVFRYINVWIEADGGPDFGTENRTVEAQISGTMHGVVDLNTKNESLWKKSLQLANEFAHNPNAFQELLTREVSGIPL